MRPFRFLATVDANPSFAELASVARKAEAVGCSAFVLPVERASSPRVGHFAARRSAVMQTGRGDLRVLGATGPPLS